MTAQDAKQLGGIARQVRALLSGIDKLPEAFDEVEMLESRVATAHEQLQDVEAQTALAKAAFVKLDGDYRSLQKLYEELDRKHVTKKESLENTLRALQAEVATTQQLKRDTEMQLAEITTAWNLKVAG